MRCPSPQDYNEAIQNPGVCFADSDLRSGEVVTNALGLPWSASGNFASVYRIRGAAGDYAVRCFLDFRDEQVERYKIVSEYVRFDSLTSTVDFHFMTHGIRVGGQWFPIIKMPWLEGDTLGVYVDKNAGHPEIMLELAKQFFQMVRELEDNDVAHGDLQHGNIIITDEGLRLVDYDALFVPGLSGRHSLELGHPNYQHPERNEWHFDATVDNFSTWLIYISLVCLSLDRDIYKRFECGDDCLIFKKKDLLSPETSPVFDALLLHESEDIRALVTLLSKLLWLAPQAVPALDIPDQDLKLVPETRLMRSDQDLVRLVGSQEEQMLSLSNEDSRAAAALLRTAAPGLDAGKTVSLGKKFALSRSKFLKRTKARLKKSLDTALRGAVPPVWTAIKMFEANRLFFGGKYEAAAEVYVEIQKDFETDSKLGFDLLLKIARCYALADRAALCQFYLTLAARSAPSKSSGSARADYRHEFITRMASKDAEQRQSALHCLTSLLQNHCQRYSLSNASIVADCAIELGTLLEFATLALDVATGTKFDDALWIAYLEQLAKLEKIWREDVDRRFVDRTVKTTALSRIYRHANAVVRIFPASSDTLLFWGLRHSAVLSSGEVSQLLMRALVTSDEETLNSGLTAISSTVKPEVLISHLAFTARRLGCTSDGIRVARLIQRWTLSSQFSSSSSIWFSHLADFDPKVIELCLDENETAYILDSLSSLRRSLPKIRRAVQSLGPVAQKLEQEILHLIIQKQMPPRIANSPEHKSLLIRPEELTDAISACDHFGSEAEALAERMIVSCFDEILVSGFERGQVDFEPVFQWLATVNDPGSVLRVRQKMIEVFRRHADSVVGADLDQTARVLSFCFLLEGQDHELVEILLNAQLDHILSSRSLFSQADLETFRELAARYPVPLWRWQEFSDWYHGR